MGLSGTTMNNARIKLNKIRDEISLRSTQSRSSYLKLIDQWKDISPNTQSMGCSNVAHTYAACNKSNPHASKLPMVGIVSSYNDMLSAHAPFQDYPNLLKQYGKELDLHIQVAAGVPAMCDGITQGEPGMELSLFSRDTIALSTAVGLSHNVFDAAICMGTCDKIVPGLMIGALRHGHLPMIFISGGPMATGISNTEKSIKRKAFAAHEIDKIELMEVEQAAYHDQGTCTFYGTANTNQLIAEAMGFQLPGAAFTPANTIEREKLTEYSLLVLSQLMQKKLSLGEMLDINNWLNGMIVLLASGGSTNLIIHLIAMARACGFIIDVKDFAELSKAIPLICKVYPNGKADVNEFHSAGGIGLLIKNLLQEDLLFNDVETVVGNGLEAYTKSIQLKENELIWEDKEPLKPDQNIITKVKNPFKENGGMKFITGDIAKGIIKVSALEDEHKVISAPAKVFFDQESVIKAFENNEFNSDTIIILLGQSPKHNGMPELHKLTSPINVLQDKGLNIALVTDGRMSGASGSFPALIHAISENLNLYKIQDGDQLTLDLESQTLEVNDLSTLSSRTPHEIKISNEGLGRELFSVFRDNISNAEEGATIFKYS